MLRNSSYSKPAGWALPLLVLVLGTFLSALGTSIINVAISAIQREFGGGLDAVRWVSTAYLLTLGISTATSSWFSERFGATRVFLGCLTAFTVASVLCGVAWDLHSLIAFRVLQAIPGGIIPVVAMTLIYRLVPANRVGAAMGMYGMGVILAPALGPAVGGWLVQYTSWHLVFFVKVPVGVAGIIAALLIFPRRADTSRPRFDVPGFVFIAVAVAAMTIAADRGALVVHRTGVPELMHAAAKGTATLGPYYLQLLRHIGTTTYANAFYMVAVMTAVGAALGLLMRSPRAKRPSAPPPRPPGQAGRGFTPRRRARWTAHTVPSSARPVSG